MKVILLAGLIAVAIGAAAGIRPDAVWGYYRELFPSNPAQRSALDQCFAQDPHFDRLDPTARAACYAHNALAVAGSANDPARRPAAPGNAAPGNFVDLWRAAGQGPLPQNDIRAAEQVERYPGPLAVARPR